MDHEINTVKQSLTRLEVEVAHIQADILEVLKQQEQLNTCLRYAMHGTPKYPGLMVRTDRLEGWRKRQTQLLVLMFTVVCPLAFSRVWEAIAAGGA